MTIRITLVLIILFSANLSAQNTDSLISLLSKNSNDSSRCIILNQLGYEYLKTAPAKSLEYASEALEYAAKTGNYAEELNAHLLIGIVKKTFGEFDVAASHYFSALKIAEEHKLKAKESVCLNNIGSLYQSQNNFSKALEYFKKSLEIERVLGDKEQTSLRLYNIGAVYESMDSLDMAYTFYFNSLLIEQELKNKEGEFYALYGLSGIETKKGNFDKAMEKISRAFQIANEIGDLNGISICYSEMGVMYRTQQKWDMAIAAFDSSIVYAEKIRQRNAIREAYRELALIYRNREDFRKAYDYCYLFTRINDTINNLEINSKVAEMETRFEIEKKEREIEHLRQTSEILAESSENEKRNKYFLLITFILCIVIAVSNLHRIIEDRRTIFNYSIIAIVFVLLLSYVLVIAGIYPGKFTSYNFFKAVVDVLTLSIFPLFAFVLFAERYLLKKHLKTALEISDQIQEYVPAKNEQVVDFLFDNEKDHLQLALKNLVCVEGSDNYSAFYYYKDDKLRKDLFRVTLKSVEDQLNECNDVVRCHKSFIVNITHIKRISGNAQGFRLHFQDLNFEVPVSRKFPREMLEKIRSGI